MSGYSFSSDSVVSSQSWTCKSDGSLLNSDGEALTAAHLQLIPPCPLHHILQEECVCMNQCCSKGDLCDSTACGIPCENLGLQSDLHIVEHNSMEFLIGSHNFTCQEGYYANFMQVTTHIQ